MHSQSEPKLSTLSTAQRSRRLRRNEMSTEDIMSMRRGSLSHVETTKEKQRPHLSFSGCGFNGLYHIGVAAALQDFAPHLYEDNMISGTSAGSLAAACLICNLSIKKCAETILDLIAACKREGMMFSKFNLNTSLQSTLRMLLPENAHILCNGKLHVSMTRVTAGKIGYTLQNYVVNQFADKEELITSLMCSSFIPMVSGFYFPVLNGMSMMDGGFTNNVLEMNDTTITVTPFAAEADICPIDSAAHQCFFDLYNTKLKFNFFNFERMANLIFPNSAVRMAKLLRLGYDDCIRYLLLRKFIFCSEHSSLFTATGENLSDECMECQQLVKRATISSVPSYIEEMIYEKEPESISYWGSILDNRFTAALFHLMEVCTDLNDNQYSELCRSMDIMHHLRMYPFIRITLKPVEWYFWMLRSIWNVLRPKGDKAVKDLKRHTRRVRKSKSKNKPHQPSEFPLETKEETKPRFCLPDELLDDNNLPLKVEMDTEVRLQSFIEDTLNSITSDSITRDSDFSIDGSIEEVINFERMRENSEFYYYSQRLNSCMSEGSAVFDDDDGLGTEFLSDCESAPSVDC